MHVRFSRCASYLCIAFLQFVALPVHADSLTEGSVLPNYTIVSVGSTASLKINSGPINGAVLVGDGSVTTTSGGNNGKITGGAFWDGTGSADFSGLNTPPTVTMVSTSVTLQAFNDADTLADAAEALTPTVTLGASSANSGAVLNFIGNGGLNVIDGTSFQNPNITITGGASDLFVFNLSGEFQTNTAITLVGVNPSQILWNLTGTGTVFQTSGGDVLYGTFLATGGGTMDLGVQNFQFSNLNLQGQLIDTAGHIEFVSGSEIPVSAPFQPTPEPGSLLLFGSGLSGLAFVIRRKQNS